MKYGAVISILSLFPNIADSVRKIEEEKVRWEKHGLELTAYHIENAREYAYSRIEPNHISFFNYLDGMFDFLWKEINESVPYIRPVKNMCFNCKASVVKGLDECQQCGIRYETR